MIGGNNMVNNDFVEEMPQKSYSRNSNRIGKQNMEQVNFLINNDEINNGIPKCFLELLVSINKNRSKN